MSALDHWPTRASGPYDFRFTPSADIRGTFSTSAKWQKRISQRENATQEGMSFNTGITVSDNPHKKHRWHSSALGTVAKSTGKEVALLCDFLTTRNRKGLSIMQSIAQKKRAERLLQWKQDGVKAASEYEAKELATRLLTAKLRAERLVREAISSKRTKKSVKVKTENHRLAVIAANRWRFAHTSLSGVRPNR